MSWLMAAAAEYPYALIACWLRLPLAPDESPPPLLSRPNSRGATRGSAPQFVAYLALCCHRRCLNHRLPPPYLEADCCIIVIVASGSTLSSSSPPCPCEPTGWSSRGRRQGRHLGGHHVGIIAKLPWGGRLPFAIAIAAPIYPSPSPSPSPSTLS